MRKSFDGLGGLVRNEMGKDLLLGDVFIFISKGKDKIKMLYWDGEGFVIYYKQLEKGRYELLKKQQISRKELSLILEGIDVKHVKYKKRYIG